MALSRPVKGLLVSVFLLGGCAGAPTQSISPETPNPDVPTQPAKSHVINYGEHSVIFNCVDHNTVHAELQKSGARVGGKTYDFASFERRFAKHMRNLDKWRVIDKPTKQSLVEQARVIPSVCARQLSNNP